MTGNCTDCKKAEFCTKAIGHLYGYCNTEFEPKTTDLEGAIRAVMKHLREEADEAEELEAEYKVRSEDKSIKPTARLAHASMQGIYNGKRSAYDEVIARLSNALGDD